jgi:hypothetical protein
VSCCSAVPSIDCPWDLIKVTSKSPCKKPLCLCEGAFAANTSPGCAYTLRRVSPRPRHLPLADVFKRRGRAACAVGKCRPFSGSTEYTTSRSTSSRRFCGTATWCGPCRDVCLRCSSGLQNLSTVSPVKAPLLTWCALTCTPVARQGHKWVREVEVLARRVDDEVILKFHGGACADCRFINVNAVSDDFDWHLRMSAGKAT